jgi:hypothetical protein
MWNNAEINSVKPGPGAQMTATKGLTTYATQAWSSGAAFEVFCLQNFTLLFYSRICFVSQNGWRRHSGYSSRKASFAVG